MTTTLQRPTTLAPPPGGSGARNGRRALVRWAFRLFRREWRQQVLAVSLLIVAVAATTVGLGLVGNILPGDTALFGTANTRFDIDATHPGVDVTADIAKARRVFGTVDAIVHANIPVPGSIAPVDLRAQALHGTYSSPTLRIVRGSYPSRDGEIAVTSGVATTFGVHIGSTWKVAGRDRHVVGTVENPADLGDEFALVEPGQIGSPTGLTLLVDSTQSQWQNFRPTGIVGISSTDATSAAQRQLRSLLVLVISTVGLVFVGLLSVAGFTVMAQRRMRALGMIGAIGATDRQVRLVMLSNGLAVGLAGALIGSVTGLATWFGLRPMFESMVGHRIDVWNVQWWAVAAGALLAMITAVLAAWWPARSVARTPIVAALSGRPPRPRPAHRFAATGGALLLAGFVLLASAGRQNRPVLIVSGIIATLAGMLLIAPLGVRLAAVLARRTRLPVRLALRDLARYQARSGAALAAVSLAIGIAASIAISAAAQNAQEQGRTGGNLPANQLIAWTPNGGAPPGTGPAIKAAPAPGSPQASLTATQLATLQRAAEKIAADLNAGAPVALDVATNPHGSQPDGSQGPFDTNLVRPVPRGIEFVSPLYVATPGILALYHLTTAAIAGSDIVTSHSAFGGVKLSIGVDPGDIASPTIKHVSALPIYDDAPNTLINLQYASALGLTTHPVGWLVQTKHGLTSHQISTAEHDAAAVGLSIETRTTPDHSLTQLRDYATAIGLILALGVLLMTVGLIRSETANDLRTLSATGAGGSTRRTLTSATAGVLALLGGLVGTAGSYLALVAWNRTDLGYLAHPPWPDLAVLVGGLPVAAVVLGWLSAFRVPSRIGQRPLE